MNILPEIAELHDEMKSWRRDLHAHPEIGFEERRTSDIVAAKLESWGIEVHRGIGVTGVVGVLRGRPGNRAIGLRADMDALAMDEENDVEHRSTISNRNACMWPRRAYRHASWGGQSTSPGRVNLPARSILSSSPPKKASRVPRP